MGLFKSPDEGIQRLKLDPRTKILIMTMITPVMFEYKITFAFIGLSSIPLLLLMSNRQFKTASLYAALFMLAIYTEQMPQDIQINSVLNAVFVLLTGLVLRLFPIFMMGIYIMHSTTVSEFIAAMERAHISRKIVIPLSVMFRFLPTIREESEHIGKAMRMRGIRMGTKQFRHNPTCLLEYRIVPLLISVVKIGDELSASALTRGLGDPTKRTSIADIGFRTLDFTFLIISFALFIAFVL